MYIYIYIFAGVVCAFAHTNKTGVASFWLTSMGSPRKTLLQSKLSLCLCCNRNSHSTGFGVRADLTTEATNLAGTTAARLDLCLIGPTYVLLENLSICAWFISWTELQPEMSIDRTMALARYGDKQITKGTNLAGTKAARLVHVHATLRGNRSTLTNLQQDNS